MAGPGTYTAYQQLQPLNQPNFIQEQEDLGFRRRQEQRIEDEIAQQRADKAQAKKDALRSKMLGQIPKNFNSGSTSLNELQGGIIQQGANRLVDIYDQLGDPNVSESEKLKLQLEAQNIENLPNNLKLATQAFQGKIQDYNEGVASGAYFRDPEFEKLTQTGFEKYIGGLDNGLPTVGFVDTNKDGKIDIMDVVSFDDIQQGIPQFQFQKQFDIDKLAIETAKNLGKSDVTTDTGFVTRQVQGPNVDALETVTTNLFVNPDGTPTETAMSELRKRGLNPDAKGLKVVTDAFKERVLANTDTLRKTDVDYGEMTAAARERRLARGEKQEEKPVLGTPVEPSKQTWGKQIDFIDTKKYRSVPVTGGQVKLPAINARVSTTVDKEGKRTPNYKNITDGVLENYTYNNKGQLVIDVSYPLAKVTTKVGGSDASESTSVQEKAKFQVAVPAETESRIAKRLGLTVNELRQTAINPDAGKETAQERALRLAAE